MKRLIKSLLVIIFFILLLAYNSHAEIFEKVIDIGFGNPRNDYAWSMTTYKDKLYVGTLNTYGGAQIWRSESGEQNSWHRVGPRFSRNLGVRCMYADGDRAIYACTSNNLGAQILRSENGEIWTSVVKKGFDNIRNSTIRCMMRYKDYLYAGCGCNGAKFFRSKNGFRWESVETNPSFESTQVKILGTTKPIINNTMIGEMAVFNDDLYAFTWTKDADPRSMLVSLRNLNIRENFRELGDFFLFPAPGAFEVWRSNDGINWEKVVGKNDLYGNGLGFSRHDPDNLNNDMVTSVTIFQGQLYLGTEHDFGKTSIWRTSEGTRWEKVLDFYELGEKFNYYVWRLMPFNGKLYVGTANLGSCKSSGVTGAQIWVSDSGAAGTFYNLVHNGMDGEKVSVMGIEIPKNYGIRSLANFRNMLFIGTATLLDYPVRKSSQSENMKRRRMKLGSSTKVGCEIWKMIP